MTAADSTIQGMDVGGNCPVPDPDIFVRMPVCYAMSYVDESEKKNTTPGKSIPECLLCSAKRVQERINKKIGTTQAALVPTFVPQQGLSFVYTNQTRPLGSSHSTHSSSKADHLKNVIIGNFCFPHLAALHNVGAKYFEHRNVCQISTAPYFVDPNDMELLKMGRSNTSPDDDLFPKILPIMSLSPPTKGEEFEKYFNTRVNFPITNEEIKMVARMYEYMSHEYAQMKKSSTEDILFSVLHSYASCQDPILAQTFSNVDISKINVYCRFSKDFLDTLFKYPNHYYRLFVKNSVKAIDNALFSIPLSKFSVFDQRTILSILPSTYEKKGNKKTDLNGGLTNVAIYNNWICSGIGQGFALGGLVTDRRNTVNNLGTALQIEKNSTTLMLHMSGFMDDLGILPTSIYDRSNEYTVPLQNTNLSSLSIQ